MKRKLILLTGCFLLIVAALQPLLAGNVDSTKTAETTTEAIAGTENNTEAAGDEQAGETGASAEKPTFIQVIKSKIIDGGVEFMGIVLICLILGLTVAIEKVITLNLSSTNVKKLMRTLKTTIQEGGMDKAREVAALQKGPVASVIAQALLRGDEGIEGVEKSIEAYGSAEVTKLEKGMSWIALFISLAPMFGFMGTVIGMIDAFGTIKNSADIKIGEVAGGIETALLTTAAGLVVAVILQVFYNYCQSKIEDITTQLEDGANSFVNILIVNNKLNK